MFEYRSLWSSVLRVFAGVSLVLLLTLGVSGLTAAPAAAQVDGSVSVTVGTGSGDTTATATGDGSIDEWENDILNGTAPVTSGGLVDQMAMVMHRALDWMNGLLGISQSPSK